MPEELKSLAESIESNVKSLLVVVATVGLFLVAPRTDQALESGLAELQGSRGWQGGAEKELAAVSSADPSKQDIAAAFGGTNPAQLSASERAALGLSTPTTVGAMVELLTDGGHRCVVKLEPGVASAFHALTQGGSATDVVLRSVNGADWDELKQLATSVSAKQEKAKQAHKDAPTQLRPPPPETRHDPGTDVETPNPAYAEWKVERDRFDTANGVDTELNGLVTQLTRSNADLLAHLDASVPQAGPSTACTIVADVKIARAPDPVKAGSPHPVKPVDLPDRVLVPLVSTTAPALDQKARLTVLNGSSLLPKLRLTADWERFSAVDWPRAEELVTRAKAQEAGEVDVLGLHVQTDLMAAAVPWLLVGGLLWQLAYLVRFRRVTRAADYRTAAKSLAAAIPVLPARSNLIATVLVNSTVVAAVVALGGRGQAAHYSAVATALVVVFALAAIACSAFTTFEDAPARDPKDAG